MLYNRNDDFALLTRDWGSSSSLMRHNWGQFIGGEKEISAHLNNETIPVNCEPVDNPNERHTLKQNKMKAKVSFLLS